MSLPRVIACAFLVAAFLLTCPRAQAADNALYEAAKREGEVVWYTSLIVNQAVRPLVDAFNKKYPGVEVRYARGDRIAVASTSMRKEGLARRVTCSSVEAGSALLLGKKDARTSR